MKTSFHSTGMTAQGRSKGHRLILTSALCILPSTLVACAPYAQVQIDLLDQSRKGIEHAMATQQSYAAVVDQLHDTQRRRIDEAFDADVRERPAIDAQWVIDHRRAYAAALDAMAAKRQADRQSAATATANLDAIDQALQKLRWLQSIPLSWLEQSPK